MTSEIDSNFKYIIPYAAIGLFLSAVLFAFAYLVFDSRGGMPVYGGLDDLVFWFFGAFILAPTLVVYVIITFWLIHRQRPPQAVIALWAPSMLVLLLMLMVGMYHQVQNYRSMRRYDNLENGSERKADRRYDSQESSGERKPDMLGEVHVFDMRAEDSNQPENATFRVIEAGSSLPASTDSVVNLLYSGYQLLPGNELVVSESIDNPALARRVAFEPPDYSRFEKIIMSKPSSQAHAWLKPEQVNTYVFVYGDHVDTAAAISHIENSQETHVTRVTLSNYTGHSIGRVRVNGWELVGFNNSGILSARDCSLPRVGIVPEIFSSSINLEWQIQGQSAWHQAKINTLSTVDMPTPSQRRRMGQGLQLLLNEKGAVVAEPYLLLEHQSYLGASTEFYPRGEGALTAFRSNYRGCTPTSSNGPGNVTFVNMTGESIDNEWFNYAEPWSYSVVPFLVRQKLAASAFDGYRLKPGQQLSFSEDTSGTTHRQRKLPLPVPDYAPMQALIKASEQDGTRLSPADFEQTFFIYEDHIESSVVFLRWDLITKPYQGIEVHNNMDVAISRIQINGHEINAGPADDSSRGFGTGLSMMTCGRSWIGRIPTLSAPFDIRWQVSGENDWHNLHIPVLPALPAVPAGTLTDEPNYYVYLGTNSNYLLGVERRELKQSENGLVFTHRSFGNKKQQAKDFYSRFNACPQQSAYEDKESEAGF